MELATARQPCGMYVQLQTLHTMGQHYADQQVHVFIAQSKVKCGSIWLIHAHSTKVECQRLSVKIIHLPWNILELLLSISTTCLGTHT